MNSLTSKLKVNTLSVLTGGLEAGASMVTGIGARITNLARHMGLLANHNRIQCFGK